MSSNKTDTKTPDETEEEQKKEMEAIDDAKKLKRYMMLLLLTVALSFLVGMPSLYYIFQEKQKNAFLEGKTIWCSNGSMLVKVSKDNGYSYDEKMDAFVDMNSGVAFYNNIDRCSY